MEPRIEQVKEVRIIGQRRQMSLVDDRTSELWRGFLPQLKDMPGRLNGDRYSVQVYPANYFDRFDPATPFEKWAGVEASPETEAPEGMEALALRGGLYAIFRYTGRSSDKRIYQYIFSTWLPASGYVLDDRPHYELLGDRYRNDDPESEEDIFIPIRPKT